MAAALGAILLLPANTAWAQSSPVDPVQTAVHAAAAAQVSADTAFMLNLCSPSAVDDAGIGVLLWRARLLPQHAQHNDDEHSVNGARGSQLGFVGL
ncbi:hypothetical protein [Leptolyngbya sp. FACHB-261]|uniref:hypothetical protein n=1 Tax=Leptolyngbya sp. FACHB-261 TaxID=2692806 RepID=UPI0028C3F784|nr:hypothetical protein [Leptolyngbya sp. FACHB-261]